MDTSTRLRIATRIHFALLRQYGEDVEVGTLLRTEADAREALWVCDASGDAELVALARQFRHAERAEAKARPAKRASAVQDLAWARDTSGFGVTRPFEEDAPASGFAASNWLKPSTWLKRNPTRPAR